MARARARFAGGGVVVGPLVHVDARTGQPQRLSQVSSLLTRTRPGTHPRGAQTADAIGGGFRHAWCIGYET